MTWRRWRARVGDGMGRPMPARLPVGDDELARLYARYRAGRTLAEARGASSTRIAPTSISAGRRVATPWPGSAANYPTMSSRDPVTESQKGIVMHD